MNTKIFHHSGIESAIMSAIVSVLCIVLGITFIGLGPGIARF